MKEEEKEGTRKREGWGKEGGREGGRRETEREGLMSGQDEREGGGESEEKREGKVFMNTYMLMNCSLHTHHD